MHSPRSLARASRHRALVTRAPRRLRVLLFGWAPLIVWMLWIYWLSARPSLPHPNRGTGVSDDFFDYPAHAFTFGVLAVLVWRVLYSYRGLGTELTANPLPFVAGGISAFYALLDELHQTLVPGRVGSWRDWLADFIGILIVVCLLLLRPRSGLLQRLLFTNPLADQ